MTCTLLYVPLMTSVLPLLRSLLLCPTSNFHGTFSGTSAVVPTIALHCNEYDMSAEQVGRQQQIKVELVCRVCNFCDFHRIHSLSPSRLQFLPCIPPVWIPDPRSRIPEPRSQISDPRSQISDPRCPDREGKESSCDPIVRELKS